MTYISRSADFILTGQFSLLWLWFLSQIDSEGKLIFEPRHDKTNKVSAPSEDSVQPGHLPSLIRVFAVCLMGS